VEIFTCNQPAFFQDGADHIQGRQRRGSGFKHHQVAPAQTRQNHLCSRNDIGEIRRFIFMKRSGNSNDKSIRFRNLAADRQLSALQGILDQAAQSRLVDVNLPAPQTIHDPLVDIHTHHPDAVRRKCTCRGQSNIPQPKNTDRLEIHKTSIAPVVNIVQAELSHNNG